MKYKNFGQHMANYTIMAIEHINENTDVEVILELMNRVETFVKSGTITAEQYAQIRDTLSAKTGYELPEDVDTEGLSLSVIAEQVEIQGGAIEEIGSLISDLMGGEPEADPEADGEDENNDQNEEA